MNALDYIIKEEKDHLVLDYDGADISKASIFLSDCSIYQNSRVKKEFVSTVISPHVQDNLSFEDIKKLLHLVLKEMNLDNRQYYAVVHQNTDTPHIHVISNRIDYDHNTWNDHHVAWKCQEACKRVSKKLQLTSAISRQGKYEGKGPAKKSKYNEERERRIIEIKKRFSEVKYKALSIDHVYDHLIERGVSVEIVQFKNGLFGVSLEFEGEKVKASKVDRLLTVIPDKDSYTANYVMQALIDRNISRLEGIRTEKEINAELALIKDDNYKKKELLEECLSIIQFKTESYRSAVTWKHEEEKQKYLARKFGKKHYQIGFKTQI